MKTATFSFFLLFASIFLIHETTAQRLTYVGVELGPKYLKYENESGLVQTPVFPHQTTQSIHLGRGINKFLAVELGMGFHNYGVDYEALGLVRFGSSSTFPAFEIPLRLKGKIDFWSDWLFLTGSIGYTQVFHPSNSDLDPSAPALTSSGSINFALPGTGIDSLRFRDETYYVSDGSFGMLETGLSIGLNYNERFKVYMAGNYKMGFDRISRTEITYRVNAEPEVNTEIYTNGNYFSLRAGVQFRISKLKRGE